MKKFLTFSFCLSLLFSCKENDSQANEKNINYTNAEAVKITQLPFKYSYPDSIDEIYTLEDFLKNEKVGSNPDLDKRFSPSTKLNLRKEKYGHPYGGKALFFKRLPDINNNSIMLFAYWDKETDYKLQTIELQTFDSQEKIIDKMIVVDGINYECSWLRS